MLSRDFNNGKKLNLHSACAVFTIMMGVLFMLDAEPGVNATAAVTLTVFGIIWFLAHHFYLWWEHQQH